MDGKQLQRMTSKTWETCARLRQVVRTLAGEFEVNFADELPEMDQPAVDLLCSMFENLLTTLKKMSPEKENDENDQRTRAQLPGGCDQEPRGLPPAEDS